MGNESGKRESYRIPDERYEEFRGKIERLQRRANKLGVGDATWTVTGLEHVRVVEGRGMSGLYREEVPDDYELRTEHEERVLFIRTYHRVEVAGDAPKLNGWALIAVLERIDDPEAAGTVIRVVPGMDEGGLERYRDVKPWCEHCNLQRVRNDTFVVRHDDGRTAQVGRQCLRDFTGHESPEDIARYASILISIGDLGVECEDPDALGGGMRPAPDAFWTRTFLALVVASIREYGWMSRTKARELDYGTSTADRALGWLTSRADYRDARIDPTAADVELADSIHEWAIEHFEEMGVSGRTLLSNYAHNLSIIAPLRTLSHRQAGIMASLVNYHRTETGREIERRARQAQRAASRHVGIVGKREELVVVVLGAKAVTSEEHGGWGRDDCYTVVRMLANGRDEVVWFASGNVEDAWSEGECFRVVGTVKAHDVREGVRQTKVNRVRNLGPAEPPAVEAGDVPPAFTTEQQWQLDVLRNLERPYSGQAVRRVCCLTCDTCEQAPGTASAREFVLEHVGHETVLDTAKAWEVRQMADALLVEWVQEEEAIRAQHEQPAIEYTGCQLGEGCQNAGTIRVLDIDKVGCQGCIDKVNVILDQHRPSRRLNTEPVTGPIIEK